MQTRRLVPSTLLALSLGCAGIPLPVPGGSSGTGGSAGGGSAAPASVAAEVVAYTNQARRRNGLPALVTSAKLTEAALLHARQMAQYQRLSHDIPGATYPTLQSRLDAVGYTYADAAENVAWNQVDAEDAVNSWMTSAGHRANILDASLTEIGAAMVRSSKGEPYWIQVFGRPAGSR